MAAGNEVGAAQLYRLYAERISAGCSPTSVRHLHRFLHLVFAHAVRWGEIVHNPVDRVDPPRTARHVFRTLTAEQAQAMLALFARGSAARALRYDLVFPNRVGRPLSSQNFLRRHFRPLLQRLGLPPMRFHDLRHTAATLLLAAGVHPKVVSELLGHTSVGVTIDLYSHVTPVMHESAVQLLGELLAGLDQ